MLLIYDYLITIERDVTLFWGRKITGATVIFYTNRYWNVLYYILAVSTTLPSLSDRVSQAF